MRRIDPPRALNRQRGIALAVALIMLVILTIIGVASMNTTSLQEKMATNMQELNHAFHAAESAVTKALAKNGNFNVNLETHTEEETYAHATAETTTSFKGWSVPKRGSGFSAVRFRTANFEIAATAVAGNRARTSVHQGVFQIVNRPNQ